MFRLPELRVDRLSFWLGFLAGCILFWLIGRIRLMLPQWKAQIGGYLNKIQQNRLAGIEGVLRTETIRRAQRQHISASFFSLDEIIVPPMLLAPPTEQNPTSTHSPSQSIASQVIPSIPDWPEILAPYGLPTITPLQAIQCGRNIAIIGQPGSGKSTALCSLACEISRQESRKDSSLTPVLLHVLDLHLDQGYADDTLSIIINAISNWSVGLPSTQLRKFLSTALKDKDRKVILLLDGIDELPPGQLSIYRDYLKALFGEYPQIQAVVTASADYLDGLTSLGFYPLGITAWTASTREEFAKQWGQLWTTVIIPEVKKSASYQEIDPALTSNWISDEVSYSSPLEWTLRLWGAYAGDLSGSNPANIIEAYLRRFLPDPAYIHALMEIAHTMIIKRSVGLNYSEVESILSHYHIPESDLAVSDTSVTQDEGAQAPASKKKKPGKARKSADGSLIEQMLSDLLSGGIFIEHKDNLLSFSNPALLGFLAGNKITEEEAEELVNELNWPAVVQTLHYASSIHENTAWISHLIDNPQAPLYRNFLIACRWLRDAPIKADWRSFTLRTLLTLLQKDTLPFSMQLRFTAAFYLSRDPSTLKLFKQLLSSKSASLRRAALIGCGALSQPQLIPDILGKLADPLPDVRYTACLAVSAIPAEAATNAVVEVLLSGSEELRQAAAESLALNKKDGQQLLEEAAGIEDILTRRAAVFGITQIHQPWAKQKLEKIAVEDSQWVVRNAAANALETIQNINPSIPRPLPPPSEASWILSFASNLGMGVLPGSDAIDVLMMVLNSGSEEDQIAALSYLRNHPTESVITAIYELLYGNREAVHEAALLALWWINLSGIQLPNPAQSGIIIT